MMDRDAPISSEKSNVLKNLGTPPMQKNAEIRDTPPPYSPPASIVEHPLSPLLPAYGQTTNPVIRFNLLCMGGLTVMHWLALFVLRSWCSFDICIWFIPSVMCIAAIIVWRVRGHPMDNWMCIPLLIALFGEGIDWIINLGISARLLVWIFCPVAYVLIYCRSIFASPVWVRVAASAVAVSSLFLTIGLLMIWFFGPRQ